MFTMADLTATSLADLDGIQLERMRDDARRAAPGQTSYHDAALALNVAMLDEDAQAAYRAIWGVEWHPLPALVEGDSKAPALASGSERFARSLAETR